MGERFELVDNLRAELLDYKQRLGQLQIGEKIRDAQQPSPHRIRKPRQKFFKKIGAFFFALSRLPQTRRRLSAVEDDIVSVQNAVIGVVESELTALARGISDLVALTSHVSEQVSQSLDKVSEQSSKTLDRVSGQFSKHLDNVSEQFSKGLEDTQAQVAADSAREAIIFKNLEGQIAALERQLVETKSRLQMERRTRQKAFTDFDRRLTLRGVEPPPAAPAVAASPSTSAQSLSESFYFLLEERYRGTREEIKRRLLVYRNDLRAARDRVGVEAPVVDIGCGRGELLELLVEDGFKAIGVDSNDMQLDIARRHGGAVIHGDAFAYLGSLADNSVLAVTGIHIVEHIPFPDLTRLMQEVVRVLKKGGVAIFETPNPRNIIVGATNFWFDPTHIRPLPPEIMELLLETVGFPHVETRPLHPFHTLDHMVKDRKIDRDVATLLFGPQDYAIIGVME